MVWQYLGLKRALIIDLRAKHHRLEGDMMLIRRFIFASMLLLVPALVCSQAMAQKSPTAAPLDLKVISGPATAGVLSQLAPRFEKETGYRLSKRGGVTGVLKRLIASGEPFDVAIIPMPLLEDFSKQGKIAPGTSVALVRVGVGIAVRSGAAKPNIGSPQALKQALLKAKSITFVPEGEAANQLAKALSTLGIADEIKTRLHPQKTVGDCIKSVVSGDNELFVSLTTIISSAKGLELAGPFPPELQHYLVIGAGVSSTAKEPKAAEALIKLLTSDEAKPVIRANGLEPVAH
jgi:molybdate transport system substrate-binding protein